MNKSERLKQIEVRQSQIQEDQSAARASASWTAVLRAHTILVDLDEEAATLRSDELPDLSREDRERLWRDSLPDLPDHLLEEAIDVYARRHGASVYLSRDGSRVERVEGAWVSR